MKAFGLLPLGEVIGLKESFVAPGEGKRGTWSLSNVEKDAYRDPASCTSFVGRCRRSMSRWKDMGR